MTDTVGTIQMGHAEFISTTQTGILYGASEIYYLESETRTAPRFVHFFTTQVLASFPFPLRTLLFISSFIFCPALGPD